MKSMLSLICLLFGITSTLSAQGDSIAFTDRSAIKYRNNDPIGQKMDYSNTVCDTLCYNGEIVLLDESPLLQLRVVSVLTRKHQKSLPQDSVYNCQRGYTAQWEIRDGNLFLESITPYDSNCQLIDELILLPSVKNHLNTLLAMQQISGTIRGGSNAVKTNYGYAFKKEYIFTIEAGVLKESVVHEMPTGLLEDNAMLNEYLKQHAASLFDGGILDMAPFKDIRDKGLEKGREGNTFTVEIPMTTDVNGETYFIPPSWRLNAQNQFEVDLTKHFEMRGDINNLHFVHTLSRGSFYPRILRTGVIYQPTYVQYHHSFYKEAFNVRLHLYTPVINRSKSSPLLLFAQ